MPIVQKLHSTLSRILILGLLCLLFSCLEKVPKVSKTLEIPELGILLNYEGWIYEEFDPNQTEHSGSAKGRKPETKKNVNVLFYLFDEEIPEAPEIRTSINFVSEPIPAKNAKVAAEDYLASIGALYSSLYSNYEILSVPQRWDLGNNKASFLESKFKLIESGKKQDVRMFQWIVLKDQTAYIFTATTPESGPSSKKDKILNMMKSVSEIPPKNRP